MVRSGASLKLSWKLNKVITVRATVARVVVVVVVVVCVVVQRCGRYSSKKVVRIRIRMTMVMWMRVVIWMRYV